MKLQPVYIDLETFWSDKHSLSRMTNIEYVTHYDTDIISAAMKVGDAPTDVAFGESDIKHLLRQVDWSRSMAIGHNMSEFDALIMAWRFGIKPAMWGCTLAMARPIHSIDVGNSLAKLVQHYGLGVKNNAALVNTKGKRLEDFTPAEKAAMAEYNKADTEQCAALFKILVKKTPPRELFHIHMATQMLVNPRLVLDKDMVTEALTIEKEAKAKALLKLTDLLGEELIIAKRKLLGDTKDTEDIVAEIMGSSKQFSELLEQLGVEVPMKPSPSNPQLRIPALAKTDDGFIALQEHPNEIVATAARVRLQQKSTLLETRLQRFLDAAEACNGLMPMPLSYCGAFTTGRWSGRIFNPQNLPRIPRDKDGNIIPKNTNALRLSLRAPAGHSIVVSDLSGIELRVNMFLWKVPYAMELFQKNPAKADLYRYFAANYLFNIPEIEVVKEQRQVGKVSHLGLGFGAGPKTFQRVALLMGDVNMPLVSDDELSATEVVQIYREAHKEIPHGWKLCAQALGHIAAGRNVAIDPWGLTHTTSEGIKLPSGRMIRYPSLRQINDGQWDDGRPKKTWKYGSGRNETYLTGPKVTENIVQALARDVIADVAYDIRRETGYEPVLGVHDEWAFVVPTKEAESFRQKLDARMRTPPTWWPELVTWSESDIAECYGEAK